MALALGSELWQLFYDLDGDRYVPKCLGKVTAVRGSEYFAGGAWRSGYPYFATEREAQAWILERPFSVPTIR